MLRAPLAVGGLALALIAAWLVVDPRTPDLAAAVYRVGLFHHLGLAVWDEHWYAGHHLPGYSLLFPALGSLLGVRLLGALAVLASTLVFERLARSFYGGRAIWGAGFFAVAALADVWAGRIAFALGVSLALGAVLALRRGHGGWAAAAAALCACASPVAGLLVALAGLTATLASRSLRPLLVLAPAPALVVVALAALFPEGGYEPYPILSFAATAIVALGFLVALPAGERSLRIGAWLYLLVCVGCLLIHSPVGSNIERYGVLLAGPLLLCAGPAARRGGEGAGARRLATALLVGALGVSAVWVVWGPVRETLAVAGSPATSAAYYAPVERFLAGLGGAPVRVEVPLTRTHWEAALLAPSVSLARGWEKQLDTRFDGVLLARGLTGPRYARWLREQAVAFVALPDVALDPSSAQEGRLIERGLPFLREVFRSAHWRIYRVLGTRPLVTGPASLRNLGQDSFALGARSRGEVVVRVRFTRYWTVTHGHGCVGEAPGGWTSVWLERPGEVIVSARFSIGGALGLGGESCGAR